MTKMKKWVRSLLIGVLSSIGGGILTMVIIWVTSTWDFMRDRTFVAIEKERDEAVKERDTLRVRVSNLERAKPMRARYGADVLTLHFAKLTPKPSKPIEIGDCGERPCIAFAFSRAETDDGPVGIEYMAGEIFGFPLDKALYKRPIEAWMKTNFQLIEGNCLGTWVVGDRRIFTVVDSDELTTARVGVATYAHSSTGDGPRSPFFSNCARDGERLKRGARRAIGVPAGPVVPVEEGD